MTLDDIVPEGFDLDEARNAPGTTPREEQERCPECEGVEVMSRVVDSRSPGSSPEDGGYRGGNPEYEEPFWCDNCGARFEEPLPPESES